VNELFDDDRAGTPADSWAPHLRIGGFSLLLPLAMGFTALVLWILIGGFGIVLGLIADVAALAWWRKRYDAVFPQDIAPRDLLMVGTAVVVLIALAFLIDYA
jgi:hypothetical protein